MTDIVVPALGESVTEGTIAKWLKRVGDAVAADEPVAELETDKVTVEVPAPAAGTLSEIRVKEGDTVAVGAVIGTVGAAGAGQSAGTSGSSPAATKLATPDRAPGADRPASAAPAQAPAAPQPGPAARKILGEAGLEAGAVAGTGPDGRVTKGDALAAAAAAPDRTAPPPAPTQPAAAPAAAASPSGAHPAGAREERVRMTRLRQRIAERLKDAQNTAAMLTTFNEADMSAILEARKKYQEAFEKKHGTRLGFMSFFVKACVNALREFPTVNASIEGQDIVYKHYFDIGVAVSTDQGLMVPVVRDCDTKGFAQIEKDIAAYGRKARDGKIAVDDLSGGTFTITNGGIFGSLMSTPILNPPQSAILGMHKIQERPMVVGGQVVVRPMMYLALSYDHRIIDGREAVSFLVRVKDGVENPDRLLLDV